MAFFLSPIGNDQQCNANGSPLVGGTITTYQAGSSTPAATYTDSTGATPQANPITLNSLGLSASPIWLTGGQSYKFVIKDSSGVTIRTVDNVSGINDTALAVNEWLALGITPTYVSATSFTVPGDQTSTLQIGRRLKTTNTSGSIYSTITNSVYTTLTTVTVRNDSGTLDSGLSAASYGLIAFNSSSWPQVATKNYTVTTSGTAPTYVGTPSPPITSLVAYETRCSVNFHSSNSGVATTLNLNGTGAIGLKQYDSTGAKVDPTIVAGMVGDVEYDGTNYVLVNALPSASGFSRGTIDGLTISNGTTDPTNEIDVSAGVARNSTNTTNLILAAALTRKSLNAAWAVGATAGMRDTGAIANGTWHIFLIRRSDTGVVDVLASLSATAPTMPTNYDSFRRIGAILRESAAIVPFTQTADYFARTTPLLDVDVTGAGSAAVTRTVAVPTGIRVLAFLNVSLKSQTTGIDGVYISDLSVADTTSNPPGGTNTAPLWTVSGQQAANTTSYGVQCSVWTNTSAQFRSRQAAGGASDRLSISALGWMDQRGKNA